MWRKTTVAAVVLTSLTLSLLCPAFGWLVLHNWLAAPGSSIGLIPLATGTLWLLWGWKHIPNRNSTRPAGGAALLAAGLWWWLAAWAAEASVLQGEALPLLLGGLVWIYGGEEKLKRLIFPIAYLWLVFPLPGLAEHWLGFPLRLWSARLAFAFISILRLPGELQGTSIVGPNIAFDVAPACSGLRTVYTFLVAGVLLARFMHERRLWFALQIATIPLATLLANSLRITAIAWSGHHFGLNAAMGLAHETAGVVFFLVVFAGFMALGLRLSRKHPGPAPATAPEKAPIAGTPATAPQPGPSRTLLAWHAGLLALTALFIVAIRDNRLTVPALDPPTLNYSLGGWAGQDVPLTSVEADVLGAARLLKRRYARDNQTVEVIISTSLPDRRLLHDPAGCYVAGGGHISKQWITQLPAEDAAEALEVGDLLVTGSSPTGVDLDSLYCRFWFEREDGLTLCRGYDLVLQTMWDRLRLRRQKNWRLFSLAVPVKAGEEDRARRALEDFTRRLREVTANPPANRPRAGS